MGAWTRGALAVAVLLAGMLLLLHGRTLRLDVPERPIARSVDPHAVGSDVHPTPTSRSVVPAGAAGPADVLAGREGSPTVPEDRASMDAGPPGQVGSGRCSAADARVGRCDECRSPLDCAEGLSCVVSPSTSRRICQSKECDLDSDCGGGASCRRVGFWPGRKTSIGLCVPDGLRREGETCVSNTAVDNEHTCAPGLLCVHHRCGRLCDPKTGSCGPGASCERVYDERQQAACFKSCRAGECRGTEACIPLGAIAHCAEAVGVNCTIERCPAGQQCQIQDSGSRVAFACRPVCRSQPCGPGQVCGDLFGTFETAGLGIPLCYDRCEVVGADCPGGQRCIPVDPAQTVLGCRHAF